MLNRYKSYHHFIHKDKENRELLLSNNIIDNR